MNIEFVSERRDPAHLLSVKGDVDMNSSPEVRKALAEIFKQKTPTLKALLIDLSQVRYMDSSGIATLVECMQNCMKCGMRLRLCSPSAPVRDVFELARLASIFQIFSSIDEALSGL